MSLSIVIQMFLTLSPEVGLFGTDVTTDWVNGANLIIDGDVIWGSCMVALPFLPAAIAGLLWIWMCLAERNWCNVLLSTILYVPCVLIGTPLNSRVFRKRPNLECCSAILRSGYGMYGEPENHFQSYRLINDPLHFLGAKRKF